MQLLRVRAEVQPEDRAYTFLDDGEVEGACWTWSDLDRRARAIAGWLQARVSPGDRALLMYPPGLEFIAAFFGCLYARVVAVPAMPPQRGRSQRGLDRVHAIISSAEPSAILTAGDSSSATLGVRSATCLCSATNTLDADLTEAWQAPDVDSDALAFL